jgi:hypothetical protein
MAAPSSEDLVPCEPDCTLENEHHGPCRPVDAEAPPWVEESIEAARERVARDHIAWSECRPIWNGGRGGK